MTIPVGWLLGQFLNFFPSNNEPPQKMTPPLSLKKTKKELSKNAIWHVLSKKLVKTAQNFRRKSWWSWVPHFGADPFGRWGGNPPPLTQTPSWHQTLGWNADKKLVEKNVHKIQWETMHGPFTLQRGSNTAIVGLEPRKAPWGVPIPHLPKKNQRINSKWWFCHAWP